MKAGFHISHLRGGGGGGGRAQGKLPLPQTAQLPPPPPPPPPPPEYCQNITVSAGFLFIPIVIASLVSVSGVSAKAGLWTLDWTMDWTMDWNMDSILDMVASHDLH